jgi:hypothetical protein
MRSYQERLDAFAEGRTFARMSRPIRNRADGWCDACGSVQARILFGVKDERSRKVYFVGERCLQQTAERGAIVRRFSKDNADEVYALRYARQDEAAAAAAVTPSPAAAVSPGILTALLVLAAPGRRLGAPPTCVSMRLEGEPASQTIALLQTWPALRRQLQTLGLDRASTEPEDQSTAAPTKASAAIQLTAETKPERPGSAPARLPRTGRRTPVHTDAAAGEAAS